MWQEAADAADDIIKNSGLGLLPATNWSNQFLPEGENNTTESIFEVQYLGGTGSNLGSSFNGTSGALANFAVTYLPLQTLADAFEPDDIRLSGTILLPGTAFGGETFDGTRSPTKLASIKSIIPDATITADGSANFIVFRFAELLLTYVEAQNELFSSPDQSVYDAVNSVRNRAGLENLPTGLSKETMREAIKQERRVEFAFEGHHFFDLQRWGADDFKAAMEEASGVVQGDTRAYEPKLLLWPVPQNEVNVNKNLLPQNPGW